VQVRATKSCTTNAHDDIIGLLNLGIGKFLKPKKLFSLQSFIKCMESSCSHGIFLSAAVCWRLLSGDLIYHRLGARQRNTESSHRLFPEKPRQKILTRGKQDAMVSAKVYTPSLPP
jgi:hypothetical protein